MCMIWAFTLRSSFYSRHFIGKNAPGPWLASAHHVLSPPPFKKPPLLPHTSVCLREGQCVRWCVGMLLRVGVLMRKRHWRLCADCKFAALFSCRFSSFVCEKYLLSATSHFSMQWGCLARGLACPPASFPCRPAWKLRSMGHSRDACCNGSLPTLDAICVVGRPDGHMGHGCRTQAPCHRHN